MNKNKMLRVLSNRQHGPNDGWIGLIPDEETYQRLKAGEVDWKELHKPRMTSVQIPRELFYRLMELDKESSYDNYQ